MGKGTEKRKPPRLNTASVVMKQLAKHGLGVRRLIAHSDGSIEYVLSEPDPNDAQHNETSENLRKLL